MNDLILENISHSYDNEMVIKEFSLRAKSGGITCLLGPSGCGKSTALRIAAGLENIQNGKIFIGNKNISKTPVEDRNIGLVFQNSSLFPHLTALKNVAFGIKKSANKQKLAQNFLKQVRMEDFKDSYPSMLSGGQQQRVALARALAHKPRIMLLDEPFANLDMTLRKTIREEALFLLKSANIPVLMVTHDPDEALQMADKIYVMQSGQIIDEGTPVELYKNPANEFVAGFFGDLNVIHGTVKKGMIQTAIGEFSVKNFADSSRIKLVIRPEFIKVSDTQFKNSIKDRVENVRFLGSTTVVYLLVGDVRLKIKVMNQKTPKTGDKIYFKVSDFLIFPDE